MVVGSRRPVGEALWLEPSIAALLVALTTVLNRDEGSAAVWVVEIVTCLGAALAYRLPLAGALVVAAGLSSWFLMPGVWPGASGLAFVVNIFAAARKGLSWRAPLTIALTVLAYLVLVERSVAQPTDRPGPAALVLSLAVLAWLGGAAWRRGAVLLEHERERAALEQAELRLSLARDLHDTVAQTLARAAIGANLALTEPDLPAGARVELERIAAECRSSAHDLRQLLAALRSQGTDPGRTVAVVTAETLREDIEEQAAGLREAGFDVEVDVAVQALSAARAQTLSAVAREAMNNMRKHAQPAGHCRIWIHDDGDDVVARFENPRQRSGRAPDGMGLTGVRERLALLGGSSRTVEDGELWELVVRLPHGVR
ncbi:MAG: hypothetical protein KDB60_03870 [Propionibacteriaceae bacterium]|nr:hypothetical protein [Propionibacteriaceae bacterium]